MQGAPLFRLAVKRLEQAIREIVKEFGVDLHDIAQLVLHQANGRILDQLTKRLGVAGAGLFRDRTLRQYVVGVIADRARPFSPFGKDSAPRHRLAGKFWRWRDVGSRVGSVVRTVSQPVD